MTSPSQPQVGDGLGLGLDHRPDHQDLVVVAELEGEQLFVFVVKHPGQPGYALLLKFVHSEVHSDLEGLAGIAQVRLKADLVRRFGDAVRHQGAPRSPSQLQQIRQ